MRQLPWRPFSGKGHSICEERDAELQRGDEEELDGGPPESSVSDQPAAAHGRPTAPGHPWLPFTGIPKRIPTFSIQTFNCAGHEEDRCPPGHIPWEHLTADLLPRFEQLLADEQPGPVLRPPGDSVEASDEPQAGLAQLFPIDSLVEAHSLREATGLNGKHRRVYEARGDRIVV